MKFNTGKSAVYWLLMATLIPSSPVFADGCKAGSFTVQMINTGQALVEGSAWLWGDSQNAQSLIGEGSGNALAADGSSSRSHLIEIVECIEKPITNGRVDFQVMPYENTGMGHKSIDVNSVKNNDVLGVCTCESETATKVYNCDQKHTLFHKQDPEYSQLCEKNALSNAAPKSSPSPSLRGKSM